MRFNLKAESKPVSLPDFHQRSAGVLLHITSLPGPFGSGDLGPEAFGFAEFLAAGRQRWWQMLPIVPIGAGNSPYSSISAFAGGWHLINPLGLVQDGWLEHREAQPIKTRRLDRVDYGIVLERRNALLRKAFARFHAQRRKPVNYEKFCQDQQAWLDDYALFCALKRRHNLANWTRWDSDLRRRQPAALKTAARELADEIEYERFVQYAFDRQWFACKQHCNRLGIALIGDLPFFVDHDSADVWANQELYRLDANGRPKLVSGCPPDYFSKTGQLWGHPQYRWERHVKTGFRWWIARFAQAFAYFDAVRIDHFLGFYRLWNIPGGAKNAIQGTWKKTPGDELLGALKKALGSLPIIAEDLGVVIPETLALRDKFGFPGLRVLQFAFEGDEKSLYDRPHRYPFYSVAYTGTHDNNTTVGWFKGLPRIVADRGKLKAGTTQTNIGPDGLTICERTLRYLGTNGRRIHEDFIKLLYRSAANLAIIPMQDFLALDEQSRMNFPSTSKGNWEWRLRPDAASDALASQLAEWTETFERAQSYRPE